MSLTDPPLDAAQLARIEGVHRGFLYQHLYATACLLDAGQLRLERLVVESDEDIQILMNSRWSYIQIKTRQAAHLSSHDLAGVIERFNAIRELHSTGKRAGKPSFYIVANRPPNDPLLQAANTWPTDIQYLYPSYDEIPDGLPRPWASLGEAVADCQARAKLIQHSLLRPEAMVWKLASHLTYLASGAGGSGSHAVDSTEIPSLFEQFVAQLHRLPDPPAILRATETELTELQGIQVIVGYPGAGKTTLASELCRHQPRPIIYVDAKQAPQGGLLSAISREIVATVYPNNHNLSAQVFAPGHGALESLGIVAKHAASLTPAPIGIVVDNAHIDGCADALRTAIQAVSFDWLILGHPGAEIAHLCAAIGVTTQSYRGWTLASVAAEATCRTERHCTMEDIARLHRLTEGNPLFVRNIIMLADSDGSRSMSYLLDAIDHGTHDQRTAQENLLRETVAKQTPHAKHVMVLLNIANTPIPITVTSATAAHLSLSQAQAMAAIRALREWSVVECRGDSIALRDAYIPIAIELASTIDTAEIRAAASYLADWARVEAARPSHSSDLLLLHIRLLPIAGRTAELAKAAVSDDEFFLEQGVAEEVKRLLLGALSSGHVDPQDCFHVRDTLCFWALQAGEISIAREYIKNLRAALTEEWIQPGDASRVELKELLLSGATGDWQSAVAAYERIRSDGTADAHCQAIAVYNLAASAYRMNRRADALRLARESVARYEQFSGLLFSDVALKNVDAIYARIKEKRIGAQIIKHLADSFDLLARCLRNQWKQRSIFAFQAHKLYLVAGAHSSAAKVGLDVVDALIASGQADEASQLLERNLIPLAEAHGFLDVVVQLRAQLAVVFAYLGKAATARATMAELRLSFYQALSPAHQLELDNQSRLIEDIAAGRVTLRPRLPAGQPARSYTRKILFGRHISRNGPCPCGSGKKYKGCCGRPRPA